MTDPTPSWLAEIASDLERLETRGRQRQLRTVSPHPAHRIQVDNRSYLNLASNDYLGFGSNLALHQEFAEALAGEQLLERVSFTASASRLLGGEHPALAALETLLAESYGANRRALVFNSGYHANIGILPALTGRDDWILSDRLVHASLIDGIRLSRAQWSRYRHNDMDHLRELLVKRSKNARRIFIVTESLFSMDGDAANLATLVDLKRQYGAILYVDEAHAVGVRGAQGLGLAEELKLDNEVDILVGTFGKALASAGAFAIVAPTVREYLINTVRSLIFTTALPPVTVWWTVFVLRRALDASDRRAQLRDSVHIFREALGAAGPGSHIVPLVVGEDHAAVLLSQRLRERGYWVPPIRPPTVPEGTARLRFSLGAMMNSRELVELATDTLKLKESM